MLVLRSVAFNVLFYLNLILHIIVAIPTFAAAAPRLHDDGEVMGTHEQLRCCASSPASASSCAACEKIPPGALLVASKHQSVWETFTLLTLFDDPAFIFKRELMWIPFFGWYSGKPTHDAGRPPRARRRDGRHDRARARGARARTADHHLSRKARAPRPARRRPTRAASRISTRRRGVPCLPVALNSGLFWPRRKFLRYPGTIVLEVLDPIPPGLAREEFAERLEREIEEAVARLTAEAAKDLHSARVVEIVTP